MDTKLESCPFVQKAQWTRDVARGGSRTNWSRNPNSELMADSNPQALIPLLSSIGPQMYVPYLPFNIILITAS